MLSFVRSGDEVVVHSIDRLARCLMDLQSIIQELNDKGVTIRFLSVSLSFSADEGCAFQTLQLQMLGAFSQFEQTMIRKRQAEVSPKVFTLSANALLNLIRLSNSLRMA